MRMSQTSYYSFAALAFHTMVIAELLLGDLFDENGDLVERQSGDDLVDSLGNAAGIGGQASQT